MTDDARMTVWHTETIPANGSTNRIRHARGEVRSQITTAARTLLLNPLAVAERSNVDLGSASDAEVEQDRRDRAAWLQGRRGRQPEPYVEFVLAGPPQYGDDDRWDDSKEIRWAKSCAAWVRKRFPDSLPVVQALHRDETAPHVHVILSPRSIDEHGKMEWGWCHARNQATAAAHTDRERQQRQDAHDRENAERAKIGLPALPLRHPPPRKRKAGARLKKGRAKVALLALQSDCHAHVGAPYGLRRGTRGSKAQHQAVDKMKAAVGHIREAAKPLVKEALERQRKAFERDKAEAELLHHRAVVGLECLAVGLGAGSYRDIEAWQVISHRAIHGSEAELAEVEELLKPEPVPVVAPPVPAPQQRGANRKRRRRKPNVVSFPGGRS